MAEKIPPHNSQAEIKLLGSCLRCNADGFAETEAILRARNLDLKPEDFYEPKHGTIYLALCGMAERREEITLTALGDCLERSGNLQRVGGAYYLIELAQSVATSANVEYWSKIVLECAQRRNLIRSCQETITQTYAAESTEELISAHQSRIHAILGRADGKRGLKPIGDTLPEAIESIQARSENLYGGRAACDGISTGLIDLDRKIGGLGRGRQIVLAARPSEGKTSLGAQIAAHAARSGNHVCVFSLEMSNQELTERILSNVAEVNIRQALDIAKSTRLLNAEKLAKDWELYIDDSPLQIEKIESRAQRQALIKQIDLIVVDYLQLSETSHTHKRYEAVTLISRRLKLLAKELNCPILTLSQLNRESEKNNEPPKLSNLRDSGAIEQDADQVLFIHAPDGNDKRESGTREIIVAKNRHGPIGQIDLYFRKDLTRFEPLSDREEEII